MTTLRVLGLLAASILLASSFAAPARAALLQNFTCFDNADLTCEGTMGFPQASGTFPPDALTVFEVSGEMIGTPFSFDLGDVTSASWQLNPNDWSFESLLIQASSQSPTVFMFELEFTRAFGLNATTYCRGSFSTEACAPNGPDELLEIAGVTAVSVPEPAALALFVGGLAGLLGWGARRRSA